MKLKFLWTATLLSVVLWQSAPAQEAQQRTLTIARQYGIGYMALVIMEHEKLLEAQAARRGFKDLKVNWIQYGNGATMNDALLSGGLDFGAVGTTAFLTLWTKTAGTAQAVGGVCAFGSFPFYLNMRNPNVKTVRDLTDKDRIALPAVGVGNQALMLQIAARQAFGAGHERDLDRYTTSMSNPDGMTALLSAKSEVDGHFTWDPYHSREIRQPGIRTILDSNVLLGGPATNILVVTTRRFKDANPKLYDAFLAAFSEATDLINSDRRRAAEIYIAATNDKGETVDEIVKMISDPANAFSVVPQGSMKYVNAMKDMGLLKNPPQTWQALYFAPINARDGS